MSFVVAAALGILLLAAAPIVAHLLRRGRAEERDFPPARLVPAAPPIARRRSRLEDRALLAVRASAIVALALLGAVPLVRCSRLSLARPSGGSIALGIVVDDSLSMRAQQRGRTRWDRMLAAARELLDSAREGDAVAIVLAGRPARLGLAATRDLAAARRALEALEPSDRATDLGAAVAMARGALEQLPHQARRVVVLSDFADARAPPGAPPFWAPLAELTEPVDDCGIAAAERRGEQIEAVVACTSAAAARGRSLELVPATAGPARAGLEPRAGEQRIALTAPVALARAALDVRLDGQDALARDDTAPVAEHAAGLVVGVVADPASTTPPTGGATVAEQALSALDGVIARPLAAPPEQERDLAGLAALVLDDPPGLEADARAALGRFLERGGVALALLGPRVAAARLGASLEPFASGAVRWEADAPKALDAGSAAWLGDAGAGLDQLHAHGRARLDGALPPDARVAARWADGQPFLLERPVGRGLALAAGLPTGLGSSELALRPAFVALLDHVVEQGAARSGARGGVAGVAWSFPAEGELSVTGPAGPIAAELSTAAQDAGAARWIVAPLLGRYRVVFAGDEQTRVVALDPEEILTPPRPPPTTAGGTAAAEAGPIEASREAALALVALLGLEVALRLRAWLRGRDPRARTRRADPTVS